MKDLMKTNCYDVEENMCIIGTCLKNMQKEVYESLEKEYGTIYEVCLEQTHINMLITKLIGMLSRVKVKKLIFASVDRSPHCVQLHYVENEIRKVMNLDDTEIIHYIAKDNKLYEIPKNIINLSKDLVTLKNKLENT